MAIKDQNVVINVKLEADLDAAKDVGGVVKTITQQMTSVTLEAKKASDSLRDFAKEGRDAYNKYTIAIGVLNNEREKGLVTDEKFKKKKDELLKVMILEKKAIDEQRKAFDNLNKSTDEQIKGDTKREVNAKKRIESSKVQIEQAKERAKAAKEELKNTEKGLLGIKKYEETLSKLNDKLRVGLISQNEYSNSLKALSENLASGKLGEGYVSKDPKDVKAAAEKEIELAKKLSAELEARAVLAKEAVLNQKKSSDSLIEYEKNIASYQSLLDKGVISEKDFISAKKRFILSLESELVATKKLADATNDLNKKKGGNGNPPPSGGGGGNPPPPSGDTTIPTDDGVQSYTNSLLELSQAVAFAELRLEELGMELVSVAQFSGDGELVNTEATLEAVEAIKEASEELEHLKEVQADATKVVEEFAEANTATGQSMAQLRAKAAQSVLGVNVLGVSVRNVRDKLVSFKDAAKDVAIAMIGTSGITKAQKEGIDSLANSFSAIGAAASKFGKSLIKAIKNPIKTTKELGKSFKENISKGFKSASGVATDSLKRISSASKSLGANIITAVKNPIGSIKELGGVLKDSLIGGFKGAKNGVSGLFSAMGGGKGAITAVVKGLNILKVALISTGIGALIVAFGVLYTFFTKSEKGANKLKGVMGGIGAVFDLITNTISDLGAALYDKLLNEDGELTLTSAFEGLYKMIRDNVIVRLKGMGRVLSGLGKLAQAALDWDGDAASAALDQVFEGAAEAATGVENLKDKLVDYGKEIEDANKAGNAHALGVIRLKKAYVELEFAMGELAYKMRENQIAIDDENKSWAERIRLLQENKKAALGATKAKIDNKSEEIALETARLDATDPNRTGKDADKELKRLYKEKQTLETEFKNQVLTYDQQIKAQNLANVKDNFMFRERELVLIKQKQQLEDIGRQLNISALNREQELVFTTLNRQIEIEKELGKFRQKRLAESALNVELAIKESEQKVKDLNAIKEFKKAATEEFKLQGLILDLKQQEAAIEEDILSTSAKITELERQQLKAQTDHNIDLEEKIRLHEKELEISKLINLESDKNAAIDAIDRQLVLDLEENDRVNSGNPILRDAEAANIKALAKSKQDQIRENFTKEARIIQDGENLIFELLKNAKVKQYAEEKAANDEVIKLDAALQANRDEQARLQKKADGGDEGAKKELERLKLEELGIIEDSEYAKAKLAKIPFDRRVKLANQTIDLAKSVSSQLFAIENARINKEIDLQKERVDKAARIAEDGNAKQLQLEEERLGKLQEEREKKQKQQAVLDKAFAQAQIVLNTAMTISNIQLAAAKTAGGAGPAAPVVVPIVLAILGGLIASAANLFSPPALFKGTDYSVEKTLGNKPGRDSHLVKIDNKERVLTGRLNSKVSHMNSDELVSAALRGEKMRSGMRLPITSTMPAGLSKIALSGISDKKSRRESESALIQENRKLRKGVDEMVKRQDKMINALSSLGIEFNVDEKGISAAVKRQNAKAKRKEHRLR